MCPTNEILPFCPTDTGTNLLTESEYAAATDRTSGNKPGVASGKLNNKAIRQATFIASQVAQYASDQTGTDILDDNIPAKLLAQIKAATKPFAPRVTSFLSSSGNFNTTYLFQIATGSATIAATYTHNAVTYTVKKTVASGVVLEASGSAAPLASGTLTKASGTGDASLTFYAVRAPLYLRVRAVGGGAGGAGGGTTGGGNGADGNDTTFGTSLIVAGKGFGGVSAGNIGGSGGSGSLGTGPSGIAIDGGYGSAGLSGTIGAGGSGGNSAFGGGATGGTVGDASGRAAAANTGGGGGGGTINSAVTSQPGSGGGAGSYVDAVITSPLATYAYAVGAGGSFGAGGTSGANGGAGGSGFIEVTEHYQ